MSTEIIKNAIYSIDKTKVLAAVEDMAKKTFGESVDLDRSSFLGFTSEVLADISSNLALKENIRQDEQYAITAKLNSSLDRIGLSHSFKEPSAIPSTITANVQITLFDSDISITEPLELVKETKISYLNYEFRFVGDILIYKMHDKNGDIYFKATLVNNKNFSKFYPTDLPTFHYYNSEGELIVEFVTDLIQIKTRSMEIVVGKRNAKYFYYFDIPKENDLVGIELYYIEKDPGGNVTKIPFIEVDNIFEDYTGEYEEYTFIVNKEPTFYRIWLDNGSVSLFVKSGSTIEVIVKETNGKIGTIHKPEFNIEIPKKIIPRDMKIYSNFSSRDGMSELTFEEKKKALIKHIQTPDFKTIITKYDYENLFSKYFNESEYTLSFLMRRNDPILISTEMFVALKNDNEEYIFTNSVNMEVFNTIFNDTVFIKPSDLFEVMDNGTVIQTNSIPDFTYEELLGKTGRHLFFSPFYYKACTNPNRLESFYPNMNKVYKQLESIYSRNENIDMTMYPVTFRYEGYFDTLQRYDTPYMKFIMDFLCSDPKRFAEDVTEFRIFLAFFTDSIDVPESCVEVAIDAETMRGEVITNIKLLDGIEDKVRLEQFGIPSNTSNETQFKGYFDITVFKKYTGTNDREIPAYLQGETDLVNDYALINRYKTPKLTPLFYNGNRVNKITAELNDIDIDKTDLYHIPLLGLFDFVDPKSGNSTTIVNTDKLFNTYEMIRGIAVNIEKLTIAPTALSVKFMNTFGKQDQFKNYDNSDLELELEIAFFAGTYDLAVTLEEIRDTIIDYIKDTQKPSSLDNNVYLSQIINIIEQKFSQVRYIRILNLTDNIYKDEDATKVEYFDKERLKTYTPSILNLRREKIHIVTT